MSRRPTLAMSYLSSSAHHHQHQQHHHLSASPIEPSPLTHDFDSLTFDASDADQIFDLDMYDQHQQQSALPHAHSMSWPPSSSLDDAHIHASSFSWATTSPPPTSPTSHDYLGNPIPMSKDAYYESSMLLGSATMPTTSELEDSSHGYSSWFNTAAYPSSAPITIPEPKSAPVDFVAYGEQQSPFLHDAASFSPGSFSPDSDFAALHSPVSPPAHSFGTELPAYTGDSISPHATELHLPSWASQLWHQQTPPLAGTSPSAFSPLRAAFHPHSYALESDASAPFVRARPGRRPSASALLLQVASAPNESTIRAPAMARSYSRRSDSAGLADDPEATIRRKRRAPSEGDDALDGSSPPPPPGATSSADRTSESGPQKSLLRPPKLAPSAWQLYFTDWIQRHQATSTKKLNVAQAAKEAGQEYAAMTPEEKEPYKRKSQALKDAREREHGAYMRTLTPDDIKRENVFRTAQRKAGKSRRGNIKDPNAPKKPLSAYFMFLQRIRSDPELVAEVFGDETETTKQSVLAATKWRSMTDDERKPFLAQAEQEKLDYEAKKKLYEDGTASSFGSFNFSILPGSPLDHASIPRSFKALKTEAASESDSEGLAMDESRGFHTFRA